MIIRNRIQIADSDSAKLFVSDQIRIRTTGLFSVQYKRQVISSSVWLIDRLENPLLSTPPHSFDALIISVVV